jgi:cytochrome c oxidase subunit IV
MCRRFYRVHSFDYQGYVVWGLTAVIMIHVAELALARSADFEIDHPSNIGKPRM